MASEKRQKLDSLTKTILSTAKGLHKHGVMTDTAYQKITKRHLGDAATSATQPITAKEIRALRTNAKLSQAVFAKCLNVTADYVSKLERGAKRPTGSTLVLLNVIQRNGIELVL
jgi:putative transcriptional regulator